VSPLPMADSRSPARTSQALRGRSGRKAGALGAGMTRSSRTAGVAAGGGLRRLPGTVYLAELADRLADLGRALEALLGKALERVPHLALRAAPLSLA
jgi:hypothetical protein